MSVIKGVSLSSLQPKTVHIEDGCIYGLLQDENQRGHFEENQLVAFFDSPYYAIKMAESIVQVSPAQHWNELERHGDSASEVRSDNSFTIFPTFEDAAQALLYHPSKLYQVEYDNELISELESPGNQICFDVAGDYLDVSKFLEGKPECFGNSSEGKITTRYADIIINPATSWNIKPTTILGCAKVASSLVEWLEFNNIRCRVTGIYTSSCVHHEIKLKDYHDKLNENDIKVFCSPDYLRRIDFALTEVSPTFSSGYGCPELIQFDMLEPTNAPLNYILNFQAIDAWPFDPHEVQQLQQSYLQEAKLATQHALAEQVSLKAAVLKKEYEYA